MSAFSQERLEEINEALDRQVTQLTNERDALLMFVIAALKSCRERGVSILADPTCKALFEEAARHMMKGFRPGGAK